MTGYDVGSLVAQGNWSYTYIQTKLESDQLHKSNILYRK